MAEDAPSSSMLRIIDESHKHAGHSGNPSGDPDAETHFNVAVVSEEFAGKRMVERHRIVYGIVDQEIKDGVHALSLKTKTMEEAKKEGMLPADHPTCKD
eukprot:CAMPEP_0182856014 /NCGR_PEP_ID=MMETSP0034_2-20130328/2189_1 /TAXON_ID=156128 /ORGANISM="Nephroselmis pyriformis, Strain CCMP717" /LENGTH=98 /DNA_ID=CAMNT_0024987049 /DNA_START=113 /DNA_END=410 /DNA_ORIENTATION=-